MSDRRPFALRMAGAIFDVAAFDPGVAVVTPEGIVVIDARLEPVAEIALGESTRERRLVALGQDRVLVWEGRFSKLWVGARGGTLEEVAAETPYFDAVVPLPHSGGFAGAALDRLVVDDGAGHRAFPSVAGRAGKGLVAVGDVVVSAGFEGLVAIDRQGQELARFDISLYGTPLAFGRHVVVRTREALVVLDERLQSQRSMVVETTSSEPTLVASGTDVLVGDDGAVRCVSFEDGAVRWTFRGTELTAPVAVGDRVVVGSYARRVAWILDAAGAVVAEVPLDATLDGATPFGAGIAVSDGKTLRHWTPNGISELSHDVAVGAVCAALGGLVSTEGEMLYLWRDGEDAPVTPAPATSIPFDTPIVVGGAVMTLVRGGRFHLRAVTPWGRVAIAPDATYRLAMSRDDALAVVRRLVDRKIEGPLPGVHHEGREPHEITRELATRSTNELLPLAARALLEPKTLDDAMRLTAMGVLASMLDELAFVLGTTQRALRAALRAGKFPHEPPRALAGWEYVGRFTTEGKLTISDPCYVGKPKSKFPLSFTVDAENGRWHAYVRPFADDTRRTAELVAMHETGFDSVAVEEIGCIGVDAGLAGVLDKSVRFDHDDVLPYEEGIVSGRGAIASTGYGDGMYPAFGATKNGKVVKVRVHVLGPAAAAIDTTTGKPAGATKLYAATVRFEVGDVVEHKKFGQGTVVRLPAPGKAEIAFSDGVKVLVHGSS